MKILNLILISVVLIILFSSSTYYILQTKTYYSVDIVDYELIVDNYVGFNLQNDSLYLGVVNPGGKSRRNITITNIFDKPAEIIIDARGKISPWISLEDNNFILMPTEKRELEISVIVPNSAELGNYSGELVIYYKKPKVPVID
jgi:hypothetical protein